MARALAKVAVDEKECTDKWVLRLSALLGPLLLSCAGCCRGAARAAQGGAARPAVSATVHRRRRPCRPGHLPACSLEGLSKLELESLADWERTFESKYEAVGRVSRPIRDAWPHRCCS